MCQSWISAVDAIGGYERVDAITQIGELVSRTSEYPIIWPHPKSLRTNERRIWQVPREYADMINQNIRVPGLETVVVDGVTWRRTQLNRRFRFYRAAPGEVFKEHVDL